MLYHLIKKDFLIVKKYVLFMLAVSILIPLFMLWRVPDSAGPMGFILSVIFAIFMLFQFVSQKEFQYPKAATLLCTTPYPRSLIVLSKYCFCLIIYALCCLIFFLETLVFPELGIFHFEMPALLFFVISVFIGIYLPVQYKFGYEKTKFVFIVIIMASPFLLPQLMKTTGGINFDSLSTVSPFVFCFCILLAGFALQMVSAFISIRIYNKADLL